MKYEIELNGRFEVEINYWSGKTKLNYEGTELSEEGKNTFLLGEEKCSIGGSLFSGVYLCRGDQKALIAKLFWYDYIAIVLPFLASLIGGALGAILGVVSFLICYKTMPYIKKFALRLTVCILIAAFVFVLIVTVAMFVPTLFGLGAKGA